LIPPVLASGARFAVGCPAKMTFGRVAAATFGTRSTPGESAHHAFSSGLQHSAARVSGGRRIRIGMRGYKITFGYCSFLPSATITRPSWVFDQVAPCSHLPRFARSRRRGSNFNHNRQGNYNSGMIDLDASIIPGKAAAGVLIGSRDERNLERLSTAIYASNRPRSCYKS